MLEITCNPHSIAVRERIGPTGERELVLDVIDLDARIVVSIVIAERAAAAVARDLTAPRVAPVSATALRGLNGASGS